MQIQVNTDHTIEGHEALADQIRGVVGIRRWPALISPKVRSVW
jgi:hypothetical protein